MAQRLLEGRVVARRVAARDGPGGRDGAGGGEERFGKRGLAAPRLAYERERADTLDGMWHGSLLKPVDRSSVALRGPANQPSDRRARRGRGINSGEAAPERNAAPQKVGRAAGRDACRPAQAGIPLSALAVFLLLEQLVAPLQRI